MQNKDFWLSHVCVQTGNPNFLLPCNDQVETLGGREVVPRNVPLLVPPPRKKWLNIIFNLNGVLCQSAMKSYADKYRPYRVKDKVLYHQNPMIIGPKAVFS